MCFCFENWDFEFQDCFGFSASDFYRKSSSVGWGLPHHFYRVRIERDIGGVNPTLIWNDLCQMLFFYFYFIIFI